MMRRFLLLLPLALTGLVASSASAAPAVDFGREIRPVLAKNCFACHGQDEAKRAAGLRLDRREAAVGPRNGRPAAIVPRAPERSPLVARIAAREPARRMPPPGSGHELTPTEIGALRRWVAAGAPYTEHWAFGAPQRPPVPPVPAKWKPAARVSSSRESAIGVPTSVGHLPRTPNEWVRHPIDAFVLARLQRAGLQPSPEADRYTLIRRLSLDLTGLPPTPAEVDAFVGDQRPDAYEKLVDRLLASPHYGERWARLWLDLARYADSAGYGSDPLRTNIWPYRDWVINAFNRNLPYDQFTLEQVAGDLLPNATAEQKIATAFHRNTMTNTEGGTDDEEFRIAAVKDRVDTTLQVWMGLTAGCAKCHSHKYDPLTQKEYYGLFALFNQTADADRPDEQPTMRVPYAPVEAQIRQANEKIDALKKQLEGTTEADAQKKVRDEIARLEKARPSPVALPVMEELPAEKARETFLLIKGNFLERGEKVGPGLPAAFHPLPEDAPQNRLGLARWLVSPENPLTARVAVNRFWAALFGTGLVETEEDFGTQGEPPSHPELLDWLAVTFRSGRMDERTNGGGEAATTASGSSTPPLLPSSTPPAKPWDTKALLRLLVTSATYRQSSRVTPERLAKDPRNRLLSRGARQRLEAEMVRDQALALAGLLSPKLGGPSVYPPQPAGLWQAAFNGQRTWPTSTGEDRYRRGLYTFWRRTVPYPSMATFDAPSREFCQMRRIRTNTPLQAFVTLNDPVYVETAQAFARRLVREGGAAPRDRATFGLRLALARPADAMQVDELLALYEESLTRYRANPDAAKALATDPLGPLPEGWDPAELASWTVVASVLLNLDGVLTKG